MNINFEAFFLYGIVSLKVDSLVVRTAAVTVSASPEDVEEPLEPPADRVAGNPYMIKLEQCLSGL